MASELPPSILALVYEQLPPVTVLRAAAVSQLWRAPAVDDRLWRPRVQELLRGKKFIGQNVLAARAEPMRQYFMAVRDAQRLDLSADELAGLEYSFRFKMAAGESWAAVDPWWQGAERPTIRLKLGSGQSGCQYVQALNDATPFWGAAGQIGGEWSHEIDFDTAGEGEQEEEKEQEGRGGQSVVTMNGHPSYRLTRHPVHWGIVLQSCWCVLAGFEIAPRGLDPHMEDEALEVTADDARQLRQVESYNSGGRQAA